MLKGRNKELIIVAGIVALIGASKVFIFDMFGIKGVPLVLSVFSTGVVAAFEAERSVFRTLPRPRVVT